MTWAFKRQLLYLFTFLIAFFGFSYLIISPYLSKAPTCIDLKQNGDETGVDCGGSCPKACTFEVDQISILWSRAFEVIPGRYNAVAYLENHNKNTAIYKIKYKFRFADKDNIYIGKREGETYVPPSGKFAVFEPGVNLGNSVPVYTTFEFMEIPTWIQVPSEKVEQLKIFASDMKLEDEKTTPRLSGIITNNSLFKVPELNVVAILYNTAGNVVSASRTYIDVLDREQEREINFTWPQPFTEEVIAKEIIPIYNIFLVKLK